jgi:hypothetical protein
MRTQGLRPGLRYFAASRLGLLSRGLIRQLRQNLEHWARRISPRQEQAKRGGRKIIKLSVDNVERKATRRSAALAN